MFHIAFYSSFTGARPALKNESCRARYLNPRGSMTKQLYIVISEQYVELFYWDYSFSVKLSVATKLLVSRKTFLFNLLKISYTLTGMMNGNGTHTRSPICSVSWCGSYPKRSALESTNMVTLSILCFSLHSRETWGHRSKTSCRSLKTTIGNCNKRN